MTPRFHSPDCHLGGDCAACEQAIRHEAALAWHRWNEADDLREGA